MYMRPYILLLSNDETERQTMAQVIGEYATLRFACNIAEMNRSLQDGVYDACLCSWAFQEGFWNDALANLRQNYPDLPVIVLSPTGGEKEWIEVLDAGAFDLLAAPYRPMNVMALLEQAVSSHEAVLARQIS